jgi:site-specific recombinase XerD
MKAKNGVPQDLNTAATILGSGDAAVEQKTKRQRTLKKIRGVYEKVAGSGEWWIQHFDSDGRRRREKAGTRSNAIDLVRKRKTEALSGKKLPEKIRARVVRFEELATDAETYCKANNQGQQFDLYRIGRLKKEFGNRPANIPIEDLRKWFGEQSWENATHNRYKTMLSLVYRLGIENGKVQSNPAKLLKHRTEDNERVRFLNQFAPAETTLEYLNPCADEESRLRAVIMQHYSDHMPEFEIALHTGMRPSEQYGLDWSRVDLTRNFVSLPKTKNGKARHIRLNAVAVAAFKVLQKRSLNRKGEVFVNIEGQPLHGYKHWFDPAVEEAGLRDFTWYCLRHTFASRLAMAGVDLLTISELMGHKTIQMTKRYAHLAPAHNQAAVDRLVTFHPEPIPADPSATRSATKPEAEHLPESVAVN